MNDPQPEQPLLSAPDAAAIDALVENGFAARADGHDARSLHAAALLGLLEVPAEHIGSGRARLIELTYARAMGGVSNQEQLAGRIAPEHAGPRLDASSARELEALAQSGWSAPASAQLAGILSLLEPGDTEITVADRARLVDSTMDRIGESLAPIPFRMTPAAEELRPRRFSRFSWRDIAAAACITLIMSAIFGPMLANLREQNHQSLCSSNLAQAGLGMSLFASDHDGHVPNVKDVPLPTAVVMGRDPANASRIWWAVGHPAASHSANLFTLVRAGYNSIRDLSCPGNPQAPITEPPPGAFDWADSDQVSYSYQLFNSQNPPRMSGADRILLADRSPVINRAKLNENIDPMLSSRNHASRGQNALYSDSSAKFLGSPVLESGDNIWLPRSQEHRPEPRLRGDEMPEAETDTFVGP